MNVLFLWNQFMRYTCLVLTQWDDLLPPKLWFQQSKGDIPLAFCLLKQISMFRNRPQHTTAKLNILFTPLTVIFRLCTNSLNHNLIHHASVLLQRISQTATMPACFVVYVKCFEWLVVCITEKVFLIKWPLTARSFSTEDTDWPLPDSLIETCFSAYAWGGAELHSAAMSARRALIDSGVNLSSYSSVSSCEIG